MVLKTTFSVNGNDEHNHPQTLNDTYRVNLTTNKAYYQKNKPKNKPPQKQKNMVTIIN